MVNFCHNLPLKVFSYLGSCYLVLLPSDISAQTGIIGISTFGIELSRHKSFKMMKNIHHRKKSNKRHLKRQITIQAFCQDSFYWFT